MCGTFLELGRTRCGQLLYSSCIIIWHYTEIYTFFSVSTSRWAILSEALKGSKSNVPKRLADTRWSAHADATNALHNGYAFIRKALWTIADDTNQKAEARHEAQCIAESMNQLEIGIMCVVWDNILERFNKCSNLCKVLALTCPLQSH